MCYQLLRFTGSWELQPLSSGRQVASVWGLIQVLMAATSVVLLVAKIGLA